MMKKAKAKIKKATDVSPNEEMRRRNSASQTHVLYYLMKSRCCVMMSKDRQPAQHECGSSRDHQHNSLITTSHNGSLKKL